MNWFLSIVIAVLSGALGLFSAGFIMAACVKWYRISGFEGGSGYAVMFAAIGGGIAGLVIGLVTAGLVGAGATPGFFKGLGCAWGVSLMISAVAVTLCWALADIPPKIDGQELTLEIELRSRFNYWKQAWWTTHQRLGLDGRPPVQEIFDLAQIRAQLVAEYGSDPEAKS